MFGLFMGGLLAYLYNRYTIPKFRTTATMLVVNDKDNSAMSALPSGGGAIFSLVTGRAPK